jgi:geranylgeranyl pyrophosphate synthase
MEGTLTLPALLLMERHPDDNPVKRLFEDKGSAQYVAQAIEMIGSSDILDESYAVACDFRNRAIAALEPLPDTPDRAALGEIADYVAARRV